MNPIDIVSQSKRAMRTRAVAPRALFYVFVGIFVLVGVRAVISGPSEPAAAPRPVVRMPDVGAQSFAESFARVYMTWDSERRELREQRLASFVADSLDADAGLEPADDSEQDVLWTSVAGARQDGRRTIVTVAVQSDHGLSYLTVPVERSPKGFLSVVSFPAFVGPPAIDKQAEAADEDEVEDEKLKAIVTRALGNYLARSQDNLLADLSPDAVISLPMQRLQVDGTEDVTWAKPRRRVAVRVEARDDRQNVWTLRYELDVEQRDRWYVRSIAVDPTFKEVQK